MIELKRRTEIQLGLAAVGLVAWAIGARNDDPRVQWVGIGFFAAATLLRFLKKRPSDEPHEETRDESHDAP